MFKDNMESICINGSCNDSSASRIPGIHCEFDLLRNKTDALIDKLESVSVVLHGNIDKVKELKDENMTACPEPPAYQTDLPCNFESVRMRLDKAHDLLDDIYNMLGMKLGETYS